MPISLPHFLSMIFMMAVDNPLLGINGLLLMAWQVPTNPDLALPLSQAGSDSPLKLCGPTPIACSDAKRLDQRRERRGARPAILLQKRPRPGSDVGQRTATGVKRLPERNIRPSIASG